MTKTKLKKERSTSKKIKELTNAHLDKLKFNVKSADQKVEDLSGGQRQRVMIAMALACEPDLMICDEPTTALDVTIQKQVLELLVTLQKNHKMGLLFISHDLSVVAELAHYVAVMKKGVIVEQGKAVDVFT